MITTADKYIGCCDKENMVLTTEVELAAFIGAVGGCLVGTLGPYYNEKKKLGWEDIDIFFDKKFLKATAVALILAVVGVGGSFPIILANVPPAASILTTLITSAVLAMTLNLGGNIVIGPSKVTQEAKRTLLEKNTVRLFDQGIENRMMINNRINAAMEANRAVDEKPINVGKSQDYSCKKCSDDTVEDL